MILTRANREGIHRGKDCGVTLEFDFNGCYIFVTMDNNNAKTHVLCHESDKPKLRKLRAECRKMFTDFAIQYT